MTTVFTNAGTFFRQQSVLSLLLIINILVFLLMKIIGVVCLLFNSSSAPFVLFFELPALPVRVLQHPWTLITYMFVHLDFWHIVFNLLCLYSFGRFFLQFFGSRQLGGIYVLGGIMGGLVFVAAYTVFPYFREVGEDS